MKVKLDENIPNRLADELATLGHEVDKDSIPSPAALWCSPIGSYGSGDRERNGFAPVPRFIPLGAPPTSTAPVISYLSRFSLLRRFSRDGKMRASPFFPLNQGKVEGNASGEAPMPDMLR